MEPSKPERSRVTLHVVDLLWIVVGGGGLVSLMYLVSGVVLCATIVGIPFGLQCMKLSTYSLQPFRHYTVVRRISVIDTLLNIIWFPVGIAVASAHVALGVVNVFSIIGIPFGVTHFRLAKMSLFPFGVEINVMRREDVLHAVGGDSSGGAILQLPVLDWIAGTGSILKHEGVDVSVGVQARAPTLSGSPASS